MYLRYALSIIDVAGIQANDVGVRRVAYHAMTIGNGPLGLT